MTRSTQLSLLLLVALSSCASSEQRSALEVLIPQELSTLDPRFSTRGFDIKVTRLVHAGLVGLDPDTLAPYPLVASRLDFPDERTLQVELKPGVRFHSGRLLTPQDVCATLEALRSPTLGSPHRAVVSAIGECTASGEHTLALTLAQPRATLLTDLEVPILRADEATSAPRPSGQLDGLGPYRLVSQSPRHAELTPADTGVLPRPRHELVVRTVRDENARALRLLAGRADVAPNAISSTLLPALDGHDGLTLTSRPGANVTYLLMQNDRPPLDQRELRRAIARAIDREQITRTLFAGRAQVAHFLFPREHWASPRDVTAEPFDRAGAAHALRGCRPLTLLTSTDRARVTLARVIAQMLGDAGVRVRVVSLDLGVLLARLDSGDFDLATLQMPELTEPHLLSWFFHPAGVPGEGGQGKNRARFRHADAARLLDAAGANRDRATRQAHYAEFARLMARELPVVPLWHEDQVTVVSRRAAGFTQSAEGRWLGLAALR